MLYYIKLKLINIRKEICYKYNFICTLYFVCDHLKKNN